MRAWMYAGYTIFAGIGVIFHLPEPIHRALYALCVDGLYLCLRL